MARQYTIGGISLPGHSPISLGPRHPSNAGLITVSAEFDGDTISSADVTSGYGHRAAEKLFEVRDYRSMIMLADRHDWLAAFNGELSLTLTVEEAMRLTPTPRATILRTLLAEHARIVEERIAAEQELLRRLRRLQSAAEMGWEEVLDTIALTERLRHPDGDVRFRAALTGHASAPAEELVDRLRSDPEPGVREAATWALVQQGPSALGAIETLADGDEQARHSLAHVLGKLRSPDTVALLGRLVADPSETVAAKAAFSLGQIGGGDAVELLGGALADLRLGVRDEATAALGRLPEAEPTVRRLAAAGSATVRAHAVEALGFLHSPESVPALIRALEDDDAEVRFAALLALGDAEGPEAQRALEALVDSPDRQTRLVAARLLADRR